MPEHGRNPAPPSETSAALVAPAGAPVVAAAQAHVARILETAAAAEGFHCHASPFFFPSICWV